MSKPSVFTASIDSAGVYTMTADEYHADPVTGGSLSSTGARALLPPSCPALFAHYRRNGRQTKKEFDYGHAAHADVLGVGDPIVVIAADNWRTKAAQAQADEARAAGKTPLLAKDAAKVTAMADALRAHPDAGPLFARPGTAEQVLVWQDERTGVWCRAMIDWRPHVAPGSRVLVCDYKTTTNAEPDAFAKTMGDYGYHQQGDWYCAGITTLGLDNGQPPAFVLIAQEKEPPHLITVAEPDAEAMRWGRILNHAAIDTYIQCRTSDTWPGYKGGVRSLELRGYLVRQYEADYNNET